MNYFVIIKALYSKQSLKILRKTEWRLKAFVGTLGITCQAKLLREDSAGN